MDREKGGTYELGAFISENIPAAAAEMQKFFGGAGDIGSFVRWATSEILAWINEAGPLAVGLRCGQVWDCCLILVVFRLQILAERERAR